jgi:hypothetical protein
LSGCYRKAVVSDDFWASTSKKQLNFVQHVKALLRINGRATVVVPLGRWRAYPYESLLQRDKVSLELSWLPDESLEDSANLPDPDEIAAEIVEDLRAALVEFEAIQEDLTPTPGG